MSPKKDTILYIDDEPVNTKLFCLYFDEYYNILILNSTKGAAEIIKNNNIKVIVTDQRMPSETGIDFIKRINPVYPDIIKIIMTAFTDPDTTLEAINKVNVYKYLLKPWKRDEVKVTLDAAIREFDLKYEKKVLLQQLQVKNEALYKAYEKLEVNEQKFRSVFSKSNDGIYILNQNNEFIEANLAFRRLIRFDDESGSMNDLTLFVRNRFPEIISKPLEFSSHVNSSISEMEIWFNSQESKIVEVNSNHLDYDQSLTLSIIRDITERRMFEKKIIQTIIQTQEEEQSRYARELHDGLGPLLSTLKMHLEWISNPKNLQGKDKIIQHSIYTIDMAIRTTKEIANNLSPHLLQRFGLIYALSSYIENLKDSAKMDIKIFSNFNKRLENKLEFALYRSILECMNNSMKHSNAEKIIIHLNDQENYLLITISDNGKGFDVQNETSLNKGMGLFNIQTRIKHFQGKFNIDSKIGSGTIVTISIPIN